MTWKTVTRSTGHYCKGKRDPVSAERLAEGERYKESVKSGRSQWNSGRVKKKGAKYLRLEGLMLMDPCVENLVKRHGAEGFGVYVYLMLKTCSELDPESAAECIMREKGPDWAMVLSVKKETAAREINVDRRKMEDILNTLAETGMISGKQWERGNISVPRVLNVVDNKTWTKIYTAKVVNEQWAM